MSERSRFAAVKALLFSGALLAALNLHAQEAQAPEAPRGNTYAIDASWGEPDGGWDGPTTWVAADGKGQVLVMVRTPPYFRVFTRDGGFVRSWGTRPEFRNAHSATFDAQGNIWATDAGSHVVYKFSPGGELLLTLGNSGAAGDNAAMALFNQPNHVAIAPNGDVYISDGYVNARIVHYRSDGRFVRIIGGTEGAEPGQLKLPHGVALDASGRILVNDSDNQRISVFDAEGAFVESWPFPSRGGIAAAPDGSVYVSDVNAGAVNILRDGQLVERIDVGIRPHGLALDSDGAIYVSDALGRKVLKIMRQ